MQTIPISQIYSKLRKKEDIINYFREYDKEKIFKLIK